MKYTEKILYSVDQTNAETEEDSVWSRNLLDCLYYEVKGQKDF
jgi:hypothetical protein